MNLIAGAATRDISPVNPTALSGYPHVPRISTGVHDPLLASALYLSNGKRTVVAIALDILMLDPPTARTLRRRVALATDVPEACVFISCTHTHSGPVTTRLIGWANDPAVPPPDPACISIILTRTEEAAVAARAAARPAEFAWTSALAHGVGGNRHSPDGITDPEASILAVRDESTRTLLACSITYGMHPTVMHEDSRLVSSDFPHYTREELREYFGQDLVVLYHNAPSGNQSPRYFVTSQTFGEAERIGRQLGSVVADAVSAIHEWSFKATIEGSLLAVKLPRRPIPSVAAATAVLNSARAQFEQLKISKAPHGPTRTAECAVFGAEGALALACSAHTGELDRLLAQYQPHEVQAIRIGDIVLAGTPGELFSEYALEIKSRSPGRTIPVCLVNGELQGYIVTPQAAAAGGYEAANSVFAPEAGAVLVDAAVTLATELLK